MMPYPERPEGVIVQLGGKTPLKLAPILERNGQTFLKLGGWHAGHVPLAISPPAPWVSRWQAQQTFIFGVDVTSGL